MIITSSNNIITHKHKGIELHYYDHLTRRSIVLGTIFKTQVGDVKIYSGFNGYYPILLKTNNMLLYTVLHFNSTNIFDSYIKKEIKIDNTSILHNNNVINIDQVYICSNETTIINMNNIKLSNTKNIKITRNLNINGNLFLSNYSNTYNSSIFTFDTLSNTFKYVNNTHECYDVTYNKYNINLINEKCINNSTNNSKNKKISNYILIGVLSSVGLTSIIIILIIIYIKYKNMA